MNSEENNKKKKLSLKDRLKDKRERAKLELILYGVFFIVIIIFVRFSGSNNSSDDIISDNKSFVDVIEDNYEYSIIITINDIIYEYYGVRLGNNSTITRKSNGEVISYYMMNDKYYINDNGNYVLTGEYKVFPSVSYYYLDIETIKEYIKLATYSDGLYKIKISDILFNNDSSEFITISINEGDNNIVIDYTELFKITLGSDVTTIVNITYGNIGNVLSLNE